MAHSYYAYNYGHQSSWPIPLIIVSEIFIFVTSKLTTS